MSSKNSKIEIPKAYYREHPDRLKHVLEWQVANPDALQTDEAMEQLEASMTKPDNKGIGVHVVQAVAAAGDEGIPHKSLLNVINKLSAPKRFDAEGLRGFLSMQGLKSDEKPDAPLEEREGNIFLTEKGKAKLAKQTRGTLVEDAHAALVVLGYKKKSASAFIELVLDADADGKLDTTEKIVKAVTKSYKTI